MHFQASNYSVSILLLMVFTVGMMIVRSRKPVENNWPMFYWLLILFVSLTWPEDTWDYAVVTVGAAAGLVLRFEFMGGALQKLVTTVEAVVQMYIIYFGFKLITA